MNNLTLLIANTITLIATLFMNYLVGSGSYGENTVGEVSDQYPTLLTPAGYAFSIWGLIYLMLIFFVVYQWYGWYKNRHEESIQAAGIWFSLANIANAAWVMVWVNEALGVSVLVILLLLFCLVRIILRLKMEITDPPLRFIAFVWWPISIYVGWIIVATVTNIAVYLKSQGWLEYTLSAGIWAVAAIILACLIYLWLTYQRNLREAAFIGVWGLIAIAVNQWEVQKTVGITAIIAAAILLLYATYHAYQHRETLPHKKLKGG